MIDFKSIENLSLVISFLVPGLIILFIRAQFITGRMPLASEAIIPYIAITLIYYGIAYPLVEIVSQTQSVGWKRAGLWFSLVIIGPSIFGLILGAAAQFGPIRWIMYKLKLHPVHPSPTAWDWWFGQPHDRWIIVTLKDGTIFGGYFGRKSFASSDPKERDVFIEKIYLIDGDGTWKDNGDKGLLIPPGEIRILEFLPTKLEVKPDVQQTDAP